MSKFLLLLLVVSLNSAAASNSIIAIVNDHLITRDAINTKIDTQKSKEGKLEAVNQQVDILLQMDKAKQLGVKPKPVAINNMLKRVASQNKLTLEQLQKRPEFGEIMASIQQQLSLNGLKELISSKAKLTISQAEIDQTIKDNPATVMILRLKFVLLKLLLALLIKLIRYCNLKMI